MAMYKTRNTDTENIPGNVTKHSEECPQTFWGMPVLLKEMTALGQSKILSGGKCLLRPSTNNRLLGRVAFRIMSNIHDGWSYSAKSSQRP